MKCNNKQQETAECEKRGCSGCFYNQEVDDLTTVYMSGFYDGEKKWKDKIKAKIGEIKNECKYCDFTDELCQELLQNNNCSQGNTLKVLQSLVEREEKENG